MSRAATRSVAVIGGGIAATAAALAFRRALPEAEVTQFADARAPEYPGAADPVIHRFHQLVGIDPRGFERATGAVTVGEAEYRLPGKAPFALVRLDEMPHFEGIALHQLWLRFTAADPAAGPAWGEVARRARRPDDRVDGLGVRFDAGAYLALLGELAGQVGVKAAGAACADELAASHDLVVEASGAAGGEWLWLEGVPGAVDWQFGPGGGQGELELIELAAGAAAWTTGAWSARAGLAADAPPAGRTLTPFSGNRLAAGRSALRCETFDGRPLSLALAGIIRAIDLLPRPGASEREAVEYNRRTGLVHQYLLDWAAQRWGAASEPPSLAALRALFYQRGRIPFRDEDPVPSGQWLGWLLGAGERPGNIDLTAMKMSEAEVAGVFRDFRA